MPGPAEASPTERVVPGEPERSLLLLRLSSREPSTQMPPLGTRRVDEEARRLIEAWIRDDLAAPGPLLSKD
jgi:hypothetical protein